MSQTSRMTRTDHVELMQNPSNSTRVLEVQLVWLIVHGGLGKKIGQNTLLEIPHIYDIYSHDVHLLASKPYYCPIRSSSGPITRVRKQKKGYQSACSFF